MGLLLRATVQAGSGDGQRVRISRLGSTSDPDRVKAIWGVRARFYALRDRIISNSSRYQALTERSTRYAKVGRKVGRVLFRVGRVSGRAEGRVSPRVGR